MIGQTGIGRATTRVPSPLFPSPAPTILRLCWLASSSKAVWVGERFGQKEIYSILRFAPSGNGFAAGHGAAHGAAIIDCLQKVAQVN